MFVKNHIGVLGDPAKLDLYPEEFYQLLSWDESHSTINLIGASEDDVSKSHYKKMFNKFSQFKTTQHFAEIAGLTDPRLTSFESRIGLFPSSASHLIKGPSFALAPVPVNTRSWYLKFKSNFLQLILKPFLPFLIRKLAYFPLGGKAASKTQADTELGSQEISEIFYQIRREDKFDWYYLEAGSGQDILPVDLISKVLRSQAQALTALTETDLRQRLDGLSNGSRIIVPRSIYGGGITTVQQLHDILVPQKNEVKLVPQLVIIGNISEEDISRTYDLVDEISRINEYPTFAIDSLTD